MTKNGQIRLKNLQKMDNGQFESFRWKGLHFYVRMKVAKRMGEYILDEKKTWARKLFRLVADWFPCTWNWDFMTPDSLNVREILLDSSIVERKNQDFLVKLAEYRLKIFLKNFAVPTVPLIKKKKPKNL